MADLRCYEVARPPPRWGFCYAPRRGRKDARPCIHWRNLRSVVESLCAFPFRFNRLTCFPMKPGECSADVLRG